MCDLVAILVGAAIGAGVGAGSAALSGGNILKGALFGGAFGALGGGAGAAIGANAGAAAGSFITHGAVSGIATGVKVGYWAGTVGGALAGGVVGGRFQVNLDYQKQSQQAQKEALSKLQNAETGNLEVNKTGILKSNSRINRTLSSLRISMIPQKKNNEEVTQNVYGVDSNTVATSTQNMTGLNIATA